VPPDDETTPDADLITSSMITSSLNRESSTSLYNEFLCKPEETRKVNWTATRPDSTATLPCPNNIECRLCVSMCVYIYLRVCPNVDAGFIVCVVSRNFHTPKFVYLGRFPLEISPNHVSILSCSLCSSVQVLFKQNSFRLSSFYLFYLGKNAFIISSFYFTNLLFIYPASTWSRQSSLYFSNLLFIYPAST